MNRHSSRYIRSFTVITCNTLPNNDTPEGRVGLFFQESLWAFFLLSSLCVCGVRYTIKAMLTTRIKCFIRLQDSSPLLMATNQFLLQRLKSEFDWTLKLLEILSTRLSSIMRSIHTYFGWKSEKTVSHLSSCLCQPQKWVPDIIFRLLLQLGCHLL